MGNCYSADHIAKDHIHTDITCNTEESQQKYRLGTVSNRLLGRGGGGEGAERSTALERSVIDYWRGLKRVLLDPNPRPQGLH